MFRRVKRRFEPEQGPGTRAGPAGPGTPEGDGHRVRATGSEVTDIHTSNAIIRRSMNGRPKMVFFWSESTATKVCCSVMHHMYLTLLQQNGVPLALHTLFDSLGPPCLGVVAPTVVFIAAAERKRRTGHHVKNDDEFSSPLSLHFTLPILPFRFLSGVACPFPLHHAIHSSAVFFSALCQNGRMARWPKWCHRVSSVTS